MAYPPVSIFFCAYCNGEERLPFDVIPEGWVIFDSLPSNVPLARCAECSYRAEQLALDNLDPISAPPAADFSTAQESVFDPLPFVTCGVDFGQECRVGLFVGPPFSTHLQRSDEGYMVALSPGQVITLFQPLTYMLDADDAQRVGEELIRMASLAREPGTLGATA